MQTFPISPKDGGHPFAFEVENVYIGPRAIAKVLSRVRGATDIRVRRPFGKSEDVHVWFKYQGKPCIVWEPYGDNSRFWIGPDKDEKNLDIREVEEAFKQYNPPALRAILGDILSLRIFGRRPLN